MTIQEFNRLSKEDQTTCLYLACTYLGRRWNSVRLRWNYIHVPVDLYQVPAGFFVEVHYATHENDVDFFFAFEAGGKDDRLPDYAQFVMLPGWMPEAE